MYRCIRCGEFIYNNRRKYCSDDCEYYYNKKQTIKKCLGCGEEFLSLNQNRKYCSDSCRLKNSRKDLKSLSWKLKRFDILKRDNYKCMICGRTANDGIILHIDHIVPISKGGSEEIDNLQTLCNECNIGKLDKFL
jgi:5-methylcytosine-specific restriction endonuclease McrA